jgi:hypothetical protein
MTEDQLGLNTDFAGNLLTCMNLATMAIVMAIRIQQSSGISADNPEIDLVRTERKLRTVLDFSGDYTF